MLSSLCLDSLKFGSILTDFHPSLHGKKNKNRVILRRYEKINGIIGHGMDSDRDRFGTMANAISYASKNSCEFLSTTVPGKLNGISRCRI